MTESQGGRNGEKIVVYVDRDLEELIPVFLSNRRKDIIAIGDAISRGDYGTARTLGHSMKGSGGGYGFDEITEIGRAIEMAAKAEDGGTIRRELEMLEDYLQRVEVVLE